MQFKLIRTDGMEKYVQCNISIFEAFVSLIFLAVFVLVFGLGTPLHTWPSMRLFSQAPYDEFETRYCLLSPVRMFFTHFLNTTGFCSFQGWKEFTGFLTDLLSVCAIALSLIMVLKETLLGRPSFNVSSGWNFQQ